jgi:spermidine synthase
MTCRSHGNPIAPMYAVCLSFLILSGMAALVYQVTWVRLLGLSVGSTSASVATVLAAFFLGMSLGSVWARHLVRRRVATLLPYVVLEALIGLAGLALLPVLLNLDAVMAAVPVLGGSLAFKFLVALVVLVIPCLCIGATFPVMANVLIRHRDEIGLRFGQLYSLNTLGAVLGAGLSGFVFIPAFGLDGAVYLAAGANFLIVLGGLVLMRATPLGRPYEAPEAVPVPRPDAAAGAPPFAGWALAILFVTGLTSIAAEVGYTKYAAIFAGTTIYGFSAILSIFLVGITLGSWLVRRRIDRIARPHLWVAWGLVLLGLSLALTRSGLNLLPELHRYLEGAIGMTDWQVWGMRYGALFALLVLPTTLFGALFPLNLRLYCGDLAGVPARTGRGYAVNTVGGILGSLLAGFVVIPWLGTDVLLLGTAALLVLVALPLLARVAGPVARGALAAATAAAVAGLVLLPPLDYKPMIAAGMSLPDTVSYAFLKEGRSSVISVTVTDGVNATLANNGLPESEITLANPDEGVAVGVLLAAIPYLLHPDPKSAFQVGFGGGITTYTLTTTDLKAIRVVELEPVVVEAVRSLHRGAVPALADPRVRLDIDDARHRLLLDPDTYDLIISQPSHPWRAGAANVFTREFDALVARKLNPGGIATQWVNLFRMDVPTLGSIVNAFYGVFPHGAVFGSLEPDAGMLLLVGSERPLAFNAERTARRLQTPSLARGQVPEYFADANRLFRYYLLSRDEALALAAGRPPNTDTNILSEVRLARRLHNRWGAANPVHAVAAHAGYDVVPYLAEPRAPALYQFGRAFLREGQHGMAARVEARLGPLDPVRARWLRHERLADALYHAEATALYERFDDWPDAVRARQARLFAEMGDLKRAAEAVDRMGEGEARRAARARLLFDAGRWEALARLPARTPQEAAWALLGVFRLNPAAGAPALLELALRAPDTLEIPQLKALAAFQAQNPGFGAGRYNARVVLDRKVSERARMLAQLAFEARDAGDMARARFLLTRLRTLAPPDMRGPAG